jgi:hypothetical protein
MTTKRFHRGVPHFCAVVAFLFAFPAILCAQNTPATSIDQIALHVADVDASVAFSAWLCIC